MQRGATARCEKRCNFPCFLIGCSSVIGRRIFTDINEFEPTAWAGVLRLSKFHDTHCITLYFPRGEIVMADAAKCAAPTELILFEFRGAPLPGAKKGAISRVLLIRCISVCWRLIFTDINELRPTAWTGVLRLSKFHDTVPSNRYTPNRRPRSNSQP